MMSFTVMNQIPSRSRFEEAKFGMMLLELYSAILMRGSTFVLHFLERVLLMGEDSGENSLCFL